MTVILDNGIVFHKGFGVDDAVSAHPRSGIDQRMVHDDGSIGNLGMWGDIAQWGANHRKLCSHLQQAVEKRHTLDGGFDLAQCNQHIWTGFKQVRQILITTNNRVSQNQLMQFFRKIYNACDLEFSSLLNHIDTGFAVTTPTN